MYRRAGGWLQLRSVLGYAFPSIGRQIPVRLYPQTTPIAKGLGKGERPMRYFDWAPLDDPVEKMPDHKVVDWAIEQLSRRRRNR